MKFLLISKRRPTPGVTSAIVEANRDIAKRNVKNRVVVNRPQLWKVAGVILLVCGLQLYGQQADAGAAAAAKAANFIVFDVPGSVGTTSANAINPEGALTGTYSDANGRHGFLLLPGP